MCVAGGRRERWLNATELEMGVGRKAEKQWCCTGGHQRFFLPAPGPLPAILCHGSECVSAPAYILLRLPLPGVCLWKSNTC